MITLKLDLQKHIFGLLLHSPEGICSKSKMAEKYSCLNLKQTLYCVFWEQLERVKSRTENKNKDRFGKLDSITLGPPASIWFNKPMTFDVNLFFFLRSQN